MRGAKVQGHASMMRSSSCPGAIINTDHEAGMAALRARQANEQRDVVITEQAAQIETLNATIKMLADHLGIEIPTPQGGDNVDSN